MIHGIPIICSLFRKAVIQTIFQMKKYSFQSDLQTRCPFRLPFQLHDGNVFIGKINHLIIKVEQSCLITFKILSEWHKPLFTHANTVCVCACVCKALKFDPLAATRQIAYQEILQ